MNTITPIVIYNDGEERRLGKQADGSTLKYENIDRSRVSAFCLEKDGQVILKLYLEEGQRLIWRKREYQPVGGDIKTIHLLGWQKKVGGENLQAICYVFEDGHIEMAGRFRENHPVFDKIELLPSECE